MTRLRSRAGLTLVELLIVTVILGALALLVAKPIAKARDEAMIAAAKAQVRNTTSAIERHLAVTGNLPRSLDDLAPYGYADSRNIELCGFIYVPAQGNNEPMVIVEALRDGASRVVHTRHPLDQGMLHIIPPEVAVSPACRD